VATASTFPGAVAQGNDCAAKLSEKLEIRVAEAHRSFGLERDPGR